MFVPAFDIEAAELLISSMLLSSDYRTGERTVSGYFLISFFFCDLFLLMLPSR